MKTVMPNEMDFLESVTHTYVTSASPQDRLIKSLAVRTFAPFVRPTGKTLELGCSDGFMTSLIAELAQDLTVVDGSKTFIETAKARVSSRVSFIHSLFEDFRSDSGFDHVFACYVLEHVSDSVAFLQSARSLLSKDGLLFVVVPNARALSRQLARHMGLIQDLFALTPNDVNHGHRRVYDRTLLNRDLHAAGLLQVSQGGLFLKPFADFQMDRLIDIDLVGVPQQEGLYQLGLEYPDLAGSLFSVCRRA
ncbi:MAG TPA: class I SAM-dependent methyltransferase [Burkholderiaceae bacterium]|nr:class I SAM-dependent methyltransferase [Burkholderiaceae bacterium]